MVLGGSLPGDTDPNLYIKIIKRLNSKGDPCRILLDADGDTLMRSIEARPHIIKPNTHEASRALGWEVKTREDAIKAGKEFLAMGIEIVLLSMGEDGALAVSKDGVWHANPPEVDTVSAVGAGDSFIGGFLSSLTLGLDEGTALRRGCAAGAATALTPGTELCHAEDIARLVGNVSLERLE
jgi:1-phosphofructokinase family hexose kinase